MNVVHHHPDEARDVRDMSRIERAAYEEGREAYDRCISANPYTPGGLLHAAWSKGYNRGREDSLPATGE